MSEMMVLSQNQGIQRFLKQKLMQYLSRMYDAKEREDIRRDAFCKAGIVQALLSERTIGRPIMHFILNRLTDGKLDIGAFDEAWKVIEDYNRTGGAGVIQRTDQRIHL